MEPKYCASCGKQNQDLASFCSECGAKFHDGLKNLENKASTARGGPSLLALGCLGSLLSPLFLLIAFVIDLNFLRGSSSPYFVLYFLSTLGISYWLISKVFDLFGRYSYLVMSFCGISILAPFFGEGARDIAGWLFTISMFAPFFFRKDLASKIFQFRQIKYYDVVLWALFFGVFGISFQGLTTAGYFSSGF